jgi:hypothetical protein
MSVRKLSVALDEVVAEEAAALARGAGRSLSAWLNRAAAREIILQRGRAAVRAWELENGPFTDDELAAADAYIAGKTRNLRVRARRKATPRR